MPPGDRAAVVAGVDDASVLEDLGSPDGMSGEYGRGVTDPRAGLFGRVRARLQGEIPADDLAAYRRAGSEVQDLMTQIEQERAEAKLQGKDAWTVDTATQLARLCAWNAFALQLLADELVDADYESQPATIGYLPPVTAQQALAFYAQVPTWLRWAHQASANAAFEAQTSLPAGLPGWVEIERCPRPHLVAMRSALDDMRRHTAAAMADVHLGLDDPDRKKAHDRIHEVLAEADAAASYADRLWAPDISLAVHEAVEEHAKRAVERFYIAGQFLAMPRLALQASSTSPQRGAPLPAPGMPGFDEWCLTDVETRARWQRDRTARDAISSLWAKDPDPSATLTIQAQIDAAAAAGQIADLPDVGHYYCCPWAPIWLVKKPVTIGGRALQPLEQFTYDVSAEEMDEGGQFVRRILVGRFSPTDEIDYCIPGAGHDD